MNTFWIKSLWSLSLTKSSTGKFGVLVSLMCIFCLSKLLREMFVFFNAHQIV